jgi:two-component system NtrC family sensor kinase
MKPELKPDAENSTILIIDDTPANVAILADYLEDLGFEVIVAQDGKEGVRRAQFAHPDLILLDVMMPGIDGFQTCRLLKEDETIADIPVIFMTALSDTRDKVAGFEAGGVDYILKPFQIEEVLVRVRLHLGLRSARQLAEARNAQLQKEVEVRHAAEQALMKSYAELQEAKQQQDTLHRQLVQSEKMASIGQLAAGVAHEINNPIAFVSSNLGTLQDYIRQLLGMLTVYEELETVAVGHPGELQKARQMRETVELDYLREDVVSLLKESIDGVQRVRTIVQNLKDFSHAGEVERQLTDLHPGIESTLNIVWNEIKHKAQVKKEYGDILPIEAVPAQLNQVFMNLLVNAAQAIESYGVITIRTGQDSDSGGVWVEIADTGKGIEPEVLPRIFEPFFTTKPIGQGTGLGLSLSYGIIQQHGGSIEVQSEVGCGTTFRVRLPHALPQENPENTGG